MQLRWRDLAGLLAKQGRVTEATQLLSQDSLADCHNQTLGSEDLVTQELQTFCPKS